MTIKPQGNIERYNKPRPGTMYAIEPVIEIASWCRDKEAKLPPEQLHLIMHVDFLEHPILARFKSPDTLGFMIEELTRYRREIWPDSDLITGEKP